MKTVGLIVANPITNYGAHLQAYATQHVIDSLSIATRIIDHTKIKNFTHYYFGTELFINAFQKLKRLAYTKQEGIIGDAVFMQNKNERIQQARDFRKRMLHDIKVYQSYEELVVDSRDLDAVLIGSDQMWLPGASVGPFYSLRFAPKGVARVSYATSLGVSYYPRYCWNSARNMWKHMDFISVREEQGARIIKEICGDVIDVEVVVDPTYLMTKEQWEDAIPVKKMCDKKYVFCYFLGEDIRAKECAKRFARKHDLHLVSIISCESFTDIDRTFADETVGAASPEEFINWIRGAEYVFTDSFHGIAFSVINHKQFYVFYRLRRDAKQSRNSRIDNILNLWQCGERLITDTELEWSDGTESVIDYDKVESIVSDKRGASLEYLKTALRVDEN
jgi:hypothetical protein